MSFSKKKSLFKKAYFYNWDNGLNQVFKFINDQNCDKATALMIFWHGSPEYYYGKDVNSFKDYEKEVFFLLKTIETKIRNNNYSEDISYTIEKAFIPKDSSKFPDFLLKETKGKIDYNEILYPNQNPFQDEILELCQNCSSIDQMNELKVKGANFNLKILNGYSYPIEVAIGNGQLEAMKFLLRKVITSIKSIIEILYSLRQFMEKI